MRGLNEPAATGRERGADACVNAAGTVPRLYWAAAWLLRSPSAVRVRLDVIQMV